MMRMRSNKAENGCPSSVIRHRGPNSSFLHPFAVLRPLIDWMMPTHTGDTNYLTNSTNSNANFIQKHPHRHTQKQWLPSVCDPVKVKVKVEVARSCLTLWTVARQPPLPMDSPGKRTGVGCQCLLQGIFPIQGSNPIQSS